MKRKPLYTKIALPVLMPTWFFLWVWIGVFSTQTELQPSKALVMTFVICAVIAYTTSFKLTLEFCFWVGGPKMLQGLREFGIAMRQGG